MKKRTLEKLGIIILSAMLITAPVATPFTTMTVYAMEENEFTVDGGTIQKGESYDNNTASNVENYGTIKNNSGEVDANWSSGKVENNLAGATIDGNYGKVDNNLAGATINWNYGTVSSNNSGGTIKCSSLIVTTNEGNIEVNDGWVGDNNSGGHIDINNNIVNNNSGIITENYGNVGNNTGTIANNYTSVDGYYGVVDKNNGTIQNQWYEVKLENNTTELTITSNSEIKAKDNNTTTDVFAHQASSITIYSTNPNKIIEAIEGDVVYVKNADGSITISNIQNPYSILTILADKILAPAPSPAPGNHDSHDSNKDKVVISVSTSNPAMVAMKLQNDPAVVAQAQKLTVRMAAVNITNKEAAVKELTAAPKQAVVGSAEYAAKQVAIVNNLTSQKAALSKFNVQSLAVVQKTGISVTTGGCSKLDTANVALLNEFLANGIPVTITFALNGGPVTIKFPAGVDLTKFIGADGKFDLTIFKACIVK